MMLTFSWIHKEVSKVSDRLTTIEEQSPPVMYITTPKESSLPDKHAGNHTVKTEQNSQCQNPATATQMEQSRALA